MDVLEKTQTDVFNKLRQFPAITRTDRGRHAELTKLEPPLLSTLLAPDKSSEEGVTPREEKIAKGVSTYTVGIYVHQHLGRVL